MDSALQTISNVAPPQVAQPSGKDPPLVKKKTTQGGRNYVKKLQEEKNSNKGWADGLRSDVLTKYLPRFKTAWFGTSRETELEEVMRDCTQEYLFQFPGDVGDASEAAIEPAVLKPYDAKAEYPLARLSPDKEKERQIRIKARKKQIREWLRYRVTRVTNTSSRADMSGVGEKLMGLKKPRKRRQAYQHWQVENRPLVNCELEARWKKKVDDIDDPTGPDDPIPQALRQLVARDLFKQLDEATQKDWVNRAIAFAESEREAFEQVRKEMPFRSPESLQSTIENLPGFLTPVMENIQKHTGLMTVVYVFGPMPSERGELGCITICSGKNLEATPVSFVKKDPQAVRSHRARLLKFAAGAFTKEDLDAARPAGDNVIRSMALVDETNDDEIANVLQPLQPAKERSAKKGRKQRVEEEYPVTETDDDEDDEEGFDGDEDSDAMDVDGDDGGRGKRRREGDLTDVDEEDAPTVKKRPFQSEYELQREQNILRNQALLKSLGLDNASVAKKLGFAGEKKKKPQKSAKQAGSGDSDAPVRRSQRHGGVPPTQLATIAFAVPPHVLPVPATSSSTTAAASHTILPASAEASTGSGVAPVTPSSPPADPSPMSSAIIGSTSDVQGEEMAPGPEQDVDQDESFAGREEGRKGEEQYDLSELEEEALLAEEEAPDWVREPLKFFKKSDLGGDWKSLLTHWVLLEREAEFMKPLRPLPKGACRPKMVGDWIVDGRLTRSKAMPYLDIGGVPDFVAQYEGWWEELQPKWRKCDGDGWSQPKYRGKDFGVLNTRGQNGWLSILACLWWWGDAVVSAEDREGFASWEIRARDALWMLERVRMCGERDGK